MKLINTYYFLFNIIILKNNKFFIKEFQKLRFIKNIKK